MIRRILSGLALLPLLCLGYCVTHVPGGADIDAANQVGRRIANGYGKFDNRQAVERTGKGKIYYSRPGSNQHPTIILYEVTSPEDVATIERLAREALVELPSVKAISLHFHREQNLTFHPSGSVSRGWESAFRKVTVTREARIGSAS